MFQRKTNEYAFDNVRAFHQYQYDNDGNYSKESGSDNDDDAKIYENNNRRIVNASNDNEEENDPGTVDEFKLFTNELKSIDMCNLFVERPTTFCFGYYMSCLIRLLDKQRYKASSLKSIVEMLLPKENVNNTEDEQFLYQLFDFTIAVINEPRLQDVSMEILLLFNLLNSSKSVIKRDDSNDSDAPALIGNISKTNNFPSRLRYNISLTILDIYEISCKPDVLFKRIRHPAYQEKCKLSINSKYLADSFLDALQVVKDSIEDEGETTQNTMLKCYKRFTEKHRQTIGEDNSNSIKNMRQQIKQDIEIIQNYPSLRRSVIEDGLIHACSISLSIERYVATRTSASMTNVNFHYPCFLNFISM